MAGYLLIELKNKKMNPKKEENNALFYKINTLIINNLYRFWIPKK
jgi:hypothetical protein